MTEEKRTQAVHQRQEPVCGSIPRARHQRAHKCLWGEQPRVTLAQCSAPCLLRWVTWVLAGAQDKLCSSSLYAALAPSVLCCCSQRPVLREATAGRVTQLASQPHPEGACRCGHGCSTHLRPELTLALLLGRHQCIHLPTLPGPRPRAGVLSPAPRAQPASPGAGCPGATAATPPRGRGSGGCDCVCLTNWT